ncbi:hypothetical protein SAMN05443575_3051 [Jatrophihabitans endophyticus]|uniref:DUF1440 domain-containing protein n=1 Tax=Jatrophihabitans endophyticus TaxID=1206085 RepID=A0A1M5PEX4_9ACTN|nr:hypothetical protein [Jatrophihabitans endophyticus]SHG99803.1 hypothetical protein SAMN05443575_3051 [Jatrophihabitans endophyticus]
MASGLLAGALAGAAGTTALDGATYLDMAVRGRPTSSTPQESVERMSQRLGVDVPGRGDARDNRVEGLAPLFGSLVGTSVGALAAAVDRAFQRRGREVPTVIAAPLIGLAAMVASDLPLQRLGITDPRTWSASDWASDVLPHLAYGVVTHAAIKAARP